MFKTMSCIVNYYLMIKKKEEKETLQTPQPPRARQSWLLGRPKNTPGVERYTLPGLERYLHTLPGLKRYLHTLPGLERYTLPGVERYTLPGLERYSNTMN
jgi:hypothetical protein